MSIRYFVAAGLGLSLASLAGAAEPARLGVQQGQALQPQAAAPSSNQQMADTIADQLRQSDQLRRFKIDIMYVDGTAEVSGHVATQPQREEALRIVQHVAGVAKVRDKLRVMQANPVMQVQAAQPQMAPMPQMAPQMAPMPQMAPQMAPMPRPADGGATSPFVPGVDPAAVAYAPPASPYMLNTPFMPPYAWPTYAPYNNYSRVAYPLNYPAEAFPFIGPFNPFPKVPLGWRRVELEWMDGHWWFGKTAQKHDWWRIRYW